MVAAAAAIVVKINLIKVTDLHNYVGDKLKINVIDGNCKFATIGLR